MDEVVKITQEAIVQTLHPAKGHSQSNTNLVQKWPLNALGPVVGVWGAMKSGPWAQHRIGPLIFRRYLFLAGVLGGFPPGDAGGGLGRVEYLMDTNSWKRSTGRLREGWQGTSF